MYFTHGVTNDNTWGKSLNPNVPKSTQLKVDTHSSLETVLETTKNRELKGMCSAFHMLIQDMVTLKPLEAVGF